MSTDMKRRNLALKFGQPTRSSPGVVPLKIPRRAPIELPRARPLETAQEEPTAGPFSIHGKKASDLEWRVYRMLFKLGWRDDQIRFQVDILGGRKPGGQVLDFVLDAGFALYVIAVNGDYWHKFGPKYHESMANEQAVKAVWPSAILRACWSGDLVSDQMALEWLRRNVGRGG